MTRPSEFARTTETLSASIRGKLPPAGALPRPGGSLSQQRQLPPERRVALGPRPARRSSPATRRQSPATTAAPPGTPSCTRPPPSAKKQSRNEAAVSGDNGSSPRNAELHSASARRGDRPRPRGGSLRRPRRLPLERRVALGLRPARRQAPAARRQSPAATAPPPGTPSCTRPPPGAETGPGREAAVSGGHGASPWNAELHSASARRGDRPGPPGGSLRRQRQLPPERRVALGRRPAQRQAPAARRQPPVAAAAPPERRVALGLRPAWMRELESSADGRRNLIAGRPPSVSPTPDDPCFRFRLSELRSVYLITRTS